VSAAPTIDPGRRHPRLALRILQSLARNIGMDYAVTRVAQDAHQLLADLNYFGYLFEALVARDLRVFTDVVDGTVQRYRDSDDLEIDAVVTAGDGRWAAFEVKLSQADIDVASANLLAFAPKVDTTKIGEPATLAVVTATGYGYTRPDGVVIIPAGTLDP
jgi:predicted AAA+ superfamily ATPase